MSIAIIPILLLHRRYDPRQEPDAAIPHVRIRAGGRREGDSYRDKGRTSDLTLNFERGTLNFYSI